MNGAELARAAQATQPDLEVLFVSGYAGDYLHTKTGELIPGTNLVFKPYLPSELASHVRDLLDRRRCA